MLTLEEFKKKNKLSNEQLAALIGISKDTLSAMLKGRGIVRNREKIVPKMKDLGITPPGEGHKVETKPREPGELITINEYFASPVLVQLQDPRKSPEPATETSVV